jgi:hypothetical protein
MNIVNVAYGSYFTRGPLKAPESGEQMPVAEPFDESKITHLEGTMTPTPLAPGFMMRVLEVQTMQREGEEDSPVNQPYADVQVDGKTVATLSNTGALSMRMDMVGQVPFGGPDEHGLSGPALAQFRADRIARALGGDIVKRDTAMTQEAFDTARKPAVASAYDALNAALAYQGRKPGRTV